MNTQQQIEQKKIWNVSAKMSVDYSMIECLDLFSSENPYLFGESDDNAKQRRLLIIDKQVEKLHGKKIQSYFDKHAISIDKLILEISEEHKSPETLFKVLGKIDDFRPLRRREPVIGIGGGVLLDIVGLASNLYRRGIPYIRVPTTLIGLIDAGIGVKTGVNFGNHKNRIGTYYQPLITYIDPMFLSTLDNRHISNGLGEILKIGLIKDESLFNLLEQYGKDLLDNKLQNFAISRIVIDKAIAGMLEELEPNLWESILERLVDFGHTFSGALEMKALPDLLHGEAVTIDMALVSVLAYQRKLLTEKQLQRILSTMKAMKLPIFHPICTPDLLAAGLLDSTSHRDGFQRFPIPTGIGKAVFINDVTSKELITACNMLQSLSEKFI